MDARTPLLSRWLVAAFTVVFAASVAAVLFTRGIGAGLSLGPGLAVALSVAAYGAFALGGFRRGTVEERVSWWVAVMTAHTAVGLLSAWLFGFIRALGPGAAIGQAFGGFAPASLVSLIAAPVAVLSLRPGLPAWRVPRVPRATWSRSGEPEPAPAARPGPMPPARWAVPARPAVTPVSRPRPALAPTPATLDPAGGRALRIPFERVANQLPPDMLALPPARLATMLVTPGTMLVPVELVLPRLHEGAVAVPATVLDDQLPRGAVLASTLEARARWSALRLVLPMDEVAAQLAAEAVPPPEISVAEEEAGSAVAPPPFHAVSGRPDGAPGDPEAPAPVVAEATAEPRAEGPPGRAPAPRRRLRPEEIDGVIACLAAAGRFETRSRDVDGLGHLLLLARGLSHDAVETVARRLIGVVPPAGGTPVIVTLITDRAALSVAAGEGAGIAVAARRPGAPVALMELLTARAAAAIRLEPRSAPAESLVRLREVSAPDTADVAALGAALDGFGGVAPAVLRDDDRRLDVYVFSPEGAAPHGLGGLASALDGALADTALGEADAVSLRVAGTRTEVRWAEGRAAALAASGVVTRPGLARRQATRAAAGLETTGCR